MPSVSDPELEPIALPTGWEWDHVRPYLAAAMRRSSEPVAFRRRFDRVASRLPPLPSDASAPRILQFLFELFLPSPFLSRVLFRDPDVLAELASKRDLSRFWTREQFAEALRNASRQGAEKHGLPGERDATIREHRRRLTTVAACDAFHLTDLKTVTLQLSLLADATVQRAFESVSADRSLPRFVVLALGKLGGEELNYSSDIDLVVVAEEATAELTRTVSAATAFLNDAEPFYRVDLRLRPWGTSGPIVTTRAAFASYFASDAADWERQAFLKARPICGDSDYGSRLLQTEQTHLLPSGPQDAIFASVVAQRDRMLAETNAERDIKAGRGSIRDIEFFVQAIQLADGRETPAIVKANTLDSLVHLADHDLIDASEYRRLSNAYVFLRVVEHTLQLRQNLQTHTLPTTEPELEVLAARLDFANAADFAKFLQQHRDAVESITSRWLRSNGLRPRDAGRDAEPTEPRQSTRKPPSAVESRLAELRAAFEQDGRSVAEVVPGPPYDNEIETGPNQSDATLLIVAGERPQAIGEMFRTLTKAGGSVRRGFVRRWSEAAAIESSLEVAATGTGGIPWPFLTRQLIEPEQTEDTALLIVAPPDPRPPSTLRPVQIAIESGQDGHTLIAVTADDSPGFLAEVSQAFEIAGLRIQSLEIQTENDRVLDRFEVVAATAEGKERLSNPSRLHELRAAIVLAKHFCHLLPFSPNPSRALLNFRRFVTSLFQRSDWIRDIAALQQSETLQALANLLGVSDFLWHEFLRTQHENLFPVLSDAGQLQAESSDEALRAELKADLDAAGSDEAWVAALNAFKDRAMLRIDLRHLLGLDRSFGRFSEELTWVAELVVLTAFERAVRERFPTAAGSSAVPEYALCALGKCGGRELGFASDIELLVVLGEAATSEQIAGMSAAVEALPKTIVAKQDGLFHLDFRLRPYGAAGPLAATLASFQDYFSPSGPAWPFERQALVKLRAFAGDPALRRRIEETRDELVYRPGAFDIDAMRALREQQVRQKVAGPINAKLSHGGLVDIEYFVQGLQMEYGRDVPSVRTPNTREALRQLVAADVLTEPERLTLRDAYRFLRHLIDALRMERGNARDLTVPAAGTQARRFLVRRMTLFDPEVRFEEQLAEHMHRVRDLTATLGDRLRRESDGSLKQPRRRG